MKNLWTGPNWHGDWEIPNQCQICAKKFLTRSAGYVHFKNDEEHMRLFNKRDTDASEDEDAEESDDEDMEDHYVYVPIFVCKENGEIYSPNFHQ